MPYLKLLFVLYLAFPGTVLGQTMGSREFTLAHHPKVVHLGRRDSAQKLEILNFGYKLQQSTHSRPPRFLLMMKKIALDEESAFRVKLRFPNQGVFVGATFTY